MGRAERGTEMKDMATMVIVVSDQVTISAIDHVIHFGTCGISPAAGLPAIQKNQMAMGPAQRGRTGSHGKTGRRSMDRQLRMDRLRKLDPSPVNRTGSVCTATGFVM